MLKFLKKLPILAQLLALILFVVFILIFILMIYYYENATIIEKKNTEYTNGTIQQVKQSITNYCRNIENTITAIAYSTSVQDFLRETEPLDIYQRSKEISSLLNNMRKNMGDGILDIIIIGRNDDHISINGGYEVVHKYKEEFSGRISSYFSEEKDIFIQSQQRRCLLVGVSIVDINNFRNAGDIAGYFIIIVDVDKMNSEVIKSTGQNSLKLFIFDRNGNILFNNVKKAGDEIGDVLGASSTANTGTYTEYINGKKSILNIDSLPIVNGKIVSVIAEESLFSEIHDLRKKIIFLFTVMLLVTAIPFTLIIKNILQPLKKIIRFMIGIKSGNLKSLKKRIQLEGYAEISVMAHEFNAMLDEIDTLSHRLVDTSSMLYKTELEKKQSELAFLQSQVNPHLLYNTFETIKGIAAVNGVDEIREVAGSLSRIFRYSVKEIHDVSLRDEIDIVRSYVRIQEIRFEDRFTVEYDFEEEALETKIPKMILQPLVENAIVHGLEPKVEKGRLLISGRINEKGDLVIQIKDDGVGIEADVLEQLMDKLSGFDHADNNEFAGIGVINVNNRVKLRYGNEYGISIFSKIGMGTEIILRIPAGVK